MPGRQGPASSLSGNRGRSRGLGTLPSVAVREMKPQEVKLVAELAGLGCGTHELEDVLALYSTDPHGFFVGEMDGRPCGTVSGVRYGADLGFLGRMTIRCTDEVRGEVGRALTQVALSYLNGRPVGLDAAPDHSEIFEDAGFEPTHSNVRLRGTCSPQLSDEAGSITDLSLVPWEEVVVYDSGCFGAERGSFLRRWLEQPGIVALGAQRLGALVGWGRLRESDGHARIGPLFADDRDVALELIGALASETDKPLVLDVPDVNGTGLDLAEELGLEAVSETLRMYRGSCPGSDWERTFGMTAC